MRHLLLVSSGFTVLQMLPTPAQHHQRSGFVPTHETLPDMQESFSFKLPLQGSISPFYAYFH